MLTTNGGSFGHNPDFNNVTVANNVTVNGDITLGNDIVGLQASARIIDDYIAGICTPDDVAASIEAHMRHIAVMSAMPHLAHHDMSAYHAAAERGAAWLASR